MRSLSDNGRDTAIGVAHSYDCISLFGHDDLFGSRKNAAQCPSDDICIMDIARHSGTNTCSLPAQDTIRLYFAIAHAA